MEFMFGQRNKKILVYLKHKFYKVYKTADGLKWRCTNKNCKAKLYTDADESVILKSDLKHNHLPHEDEKLCYQKVTASAKRKAAENLLERPKKIILEEISCLGETSEDNTKKYVANMRTSLYRTRKKIREALQKNQAEGRTKNRGVPCENSKESDASNTRNEQDSNSSDSINKEDTENRPDDTLKEQEAAGTSSSRTEESSTGPSDAKPQYELKEKRRFVNVAFFVKSLKDLNSHGGDGCTFSDMNISGETKNGWNNGIKLSCSVCLTTVIVWMDDPSAKLVNSQPPAPSTSAGTAKEKQLTAEEIPTKKRRIDNQGTPLQPADSLVQVGTMVPPTDPQVQQETVAPPTDPQVQQETVVPPADPLVQLQTMAPSAHPLVQLQSLTTNINVPPTLARPFGPQSNKSSVQCWRNNPMHPIHPQVPQLGRPFLGSQSNSPLQNRMLNPTLSGNPHFMVPPQLASPLVPQSNAPHQGWRHNSLHARNQFIMQPQITRPFVPQSDSSPHQYWMYNPSLSNNPHFVVAPPLATPFLIPQSNTVHQEGADNPFQSIDPHSINQTAFVKQELVSPEDAADSSINRVPTSSTQPACMQLLFCVEPSENLNTMPGSANESTTLTPNDENCQTSSTTVVESSQNLVNSEIIVPEITPAEVLPVDLNLVKEEIEDESQSMECSVRLVPHSETSLNHSESPFASELSIKSEIVKDSPLTNIESVIPSTIEATESGAKPFAPVSDSLSAKDSTVSS